MISFIHSWVVLPSYLSYLHFCFVSTRAKVIAKALRICAVALDGQKRLHKTLCESNGDWHMRSMTQRESAVLNHVQALDVLFLNPLVQSTFQRIFLIPIVFGTLEEIEVNWNDSRGCKALVGVSDQSLSCRRFIQVCSGSSKLQAWKNWKNSRRIDSQIRDWILNMKVCLDMLGYAEIMCPWFGRIATLKHFLLIA